MKNCLWCDPFAGSFKPSYKGSTYQQEETDRESAFCLAKRLLCQVASEFWFLSFTLFKWLSKHLKGWSTTLDFFPKHQGICIGNSHRLSRDSSKVLKTKSLKAASMLKQKPNQNHQNQQNNKTPKSQSIGFSEVSHVFLFPVHAKWVLESLQIDILVPFPQAYTSLQLTLQTLRKKMGAVEEKPSHFLHHFMPITTKKWHHPNV